MATITLELDLVGEPSEEDLAFVAGYATHLIEHGLANVLDYRVQEIRADF